MTAPPEPSKDRLVAEATEDDKGVRLDVFLSKCLPELSRTRVQALIKQGEVRLSDATIVDAKYRVKPGDRFEVTVPPPVPAEPEA